MPVKESYRAEGYSAPVSFHAKLRREAEAREMNASELFRRAIELYLRVNPVEPQQKAS